MNIFYTRIGNQVVGMIPGDILVRDKDIFTEHFGIALGFYQGYYWVAENNTPHGVRVLTLKDFLQGKPLVRIEKGYKSQDEMEVLLAKVKEKLGRPYDLLNYNCEHFANEVQKGKPYSKQVQIVSVSALCLLFVGLAFVVD